MPTTTYFASQSFASFATAIPQIVRFLINDHSSITGPDWTIVEAFSNSMREIPSDPTNLDSLVVATDWAADSPAVNDWIVLESAGGNVSAHFQFYIEYQATTQMQIIMFPLADFATGGADVSPPTFPATAVGNGGGVITFTNSPVALSTWSIVADEGTGIFLQDGPDERFSYVGEIDSIWNSGSVLKDPRPFVITDQNAYSVGQTIGDRLSPGDNSTILTVGTSVVLQYQNSGAGDTSQDLLNAGSSSGSGWTTIAPMGVYFQDDGHEHFAGWYRYMWSTGDGWETSPFSGAGTLTGSNFNEHGIMYRRASTVDPGISFSWDGTTLYGPSGYTVISGTIIDPPDIAAGRILGDMGFFQIPRVAAAATTETVETATTNVDKNKLRHTYPDNRKKNTNSGKLS